MPYTVQIDRIGGSGPEAGTPVEQETSSESEAIIALRRAVAAPRRTEEPMRFSVYDPENRLVMSYVSEAPAQPDSEAGVR